MSVGFNDEPRVQHETTGQHATISVVQERTPSAPLSGLEVLTQLASDARAALDDLLDRSATRYEDVNAGGGAFLFLGWNKWQWTALPDSAQPTVKRAREATGLLQDFARAAVRVAAPERGEHLVGPEQLFRLVIEQPNGSYPNGAPADSIDAVKQKVAASLDDYLAVLRSLPTAYGAGDRLLVADTSALLDRPDLQAWHPDGGHWTLVALPQVLSELDERKRDPRTREAAQKVIRQIEELDRRGDTFAGVPLAGKVRFREVPITADMSRTLPWLRADVPDDVIVAGALELTWTDLSGCVAVIASDRNVRNKARLAGLTVLRPQDV